MRETIPDWVVQHADEVVMIDLTPRALLHRLERGVIYGREKAERAMENFFRESTLVALRELALRQAAHEVEHRLADDKDADDEGNDKASLERPETTQTQRILVYITADPQTAVSIRRAMRVSDFLEAECYAVAITPSPDFSALPENERDAINKHLNFARKLHIETRVLEGEDPARILVDFAHRNRITQIFLTRPADRPWLPFLSRNLVQQVVGLAKDIQIVIVGERELLKH